MEFYQKIKNDDSHLLNKPPRIFYLNLGNTQKENQLKNEEKASPQGESAKNQTPIFHFQFPIQLKTKESEIKGQQSSRINETISQDFRFKEFKKCGIQQIKYQYDENTEIQSNILFQKQKEQQKDQVEKKYFYQQEEDQKSLKMEIKNIKNYKKKLNKKYQSLEKKKQYLINSRNSSPSRVEVCKSNDLPQSPSNAFKEQTQIKIVRREELLEQKYQMEPCHLRAEIQKNDIIHEFRPQFIYNNLFSNNPLTIQVEKIDLNSLKGSIDKKYFSNSNDISNNSKLYFNKKQQTKAEIFLQEVKQTDIAKKLKADIDSSNNWDEYNSNLKSNQYYDQPQSYF